MHNNNITILTFLNIYNYLFQAIRRVGGNQFQLECENLTNKPFDQTSQEIMLNIKISNDEIKELKQSLESLKKEIEISKEDIIPRNIRGKLMLIC